MPTEEELVRATCRKLIGIKSSEDVVASIEETFNLGLGPVIPRYVLSNYSNPDSILDFGCGPEALYVRYLRAKGYDIIGYDLVLLEDTYNSSILKSAINGLIDLSAPQKKYKMILASNVFNIQPSWKFCSHTLSLIKLMMDYDSTLLLNFPKGPRTDWWGESIKEGDNKLKEILKGDFWFAERITKSIWECKDPK